MVRLFAFFNPFTILLIVNLLVVIFYDYFSTTMVLLLVPIIFAAIFVTFILKKFLEAFLNDPNKARQSVCLNHQLWRFIGSIIIIIGFAELAFFGVPLVGDIQYIHFGFPLLHHIAVSTWLLIFIQFKNKHLNLAKNVFAFLFPILIFNRDIFLLTTLCFVFRLFILGKLKFTHLMVFLWLFLILFSYIGSIRSGNINELINLPVNLDLKNINPLFFWIFVYTTSPSFNLHFDILSEKSRYLYDPLLTVFPEYYKFIESFSFLGFYLYLFVGVFIIMLPRLIKFPGWICFSFFFYYQFIMGCVFSNKLLNTHSIFVLLIICCVYFGRQLIKKQNHLNGS